MDQFCDLRGMLEQAPGNPVVWDRFFESLGQMTDCETCYLLVNHDVHKERIDFLFSFNLTENKKNQILTAFKEDSFHSLLISNPKQVFCSQGIEGKVRPKCYSAGFSIQCNTHHTLVICISRSRPFSNSEQCDVEQLLRNIISALEAAIITELEHKIASQILPYCHEHFDCFVIVDGALNILFSDAVFSSVIEKKYCINLSDKRFQFLAVDLQNRLIDCIAKNELALLYSDADCWLITLIPVSVLDNLYAWECFSHAYVLAFTEDMEINPVFDRLIKVHQLSKTEAVCALDFMQNPCIPDIAKKNCRAEDTIRNHIKHIMHKMKVHNQAALMKKLISLSAL